MIDKQLLKKRFSKSATIYDQYASVQRKMAHYLMQWVESKAKVQWRHDLQVNILEIGCGTGYLTKLLFEMFPQAQITAVDMADGMITEAKKRVGNDHNILFQSGDIEMMKIEGAFDLIISNAAFQWFNQPGNTMQKLVSRLKEGGLFCFSTFGEHTFEELHDAYKQAKKKLGLTTNESLGQSFYKFNDLYRMCEQSVACSPAFFELNMETNVVTGKETEELEYFPSVKDFFLTLKKMGANNSNKDGYCQRPSLIKECMKMYEQYYHVENQIRATYHCCFFKIENPYGG